MRIVSSGYVGIGTSTPAYKLDVNGVVRSSSYALATGFTSAPRALISTVLLATIPCPSAPIASTTG